MKLESFTSFFYSPATTAKKGTKKRDAGAKLLFCFSKLIAFFTVLVAVAVVVA